MKKGVKKDNGFFIGHFVLVSEDQKEVMDAITTTFREGCIL